MSPRAFIILIGLVLLLGGPALSFVVFLNHPDFEFQWIAGAGVVLGVLTLIGSTVRTDQDQRRDAAKPAIEPTPVTPTPKPRTETRKVQCAKCGQVLQVSASLARTQCRSCKTHLKINPPADPTG